MKINFNNARKQALYRHDDLVKKLNAAIIKNEEQYAVPNDVHHGNPVNLRGYVLIDAEDIQDSMDAIRMLLGSIAGTYEDGNEEFKDVFSEVYPDDDSSMPCFNQEEE